MDKEALLSFRIFYFHAEKGARLSFRSASPGTDGGVSIHFLPRPGKEPLYGIDAVMTYARQSTDFIFMETAVFEDLPENIRRWSEQIEYDTDNPDILLSLITK